MKLSKIAKAVIAGSVLMAGVAQAGVTGNVAFTSDYLFRGVSQTMNNAAVQGTLSYAFDSGLYLTAWGSSAGFANPDGGMELDTLIGYGGKAGDLSYDVGVMRYNYPGANEPYAYEEVYGSVSMAGAKLGVNYSPDYYNESDKFLYTYVSYGTEVAGVAVSASAGLNTFDSVAMMQKALGTTSDDDSYVDYKVAFGKTLDGVALELAYVGSNIKEEDLANKLSEGRVVFTATKSF